MSAEQQLADIAFSTPGVRGSISVSVASPYVVTSVSALNSSYVAVNGKLKETPLGGVRFEAAYIPVKHSSNNQAASLSGFG